MGKKITKVFFILCLSVGLITASFAQRQTGSIKGRVTDNEGDVFPGITVIAKSEALMGTRSYVTAETGSFRFPALPPGKYTITAKMPGFKTVQRGDITVRVGMVLTVDITMEMTVLEEEVTVIAASPVVDMEQAKVAVTMDKNLLRNIPMARDLYDVVNSAPGALSEGVEYRRTSSIRGSTIRGNTYALDGVDVNDPATRYLVTNINFDIMDEVEMVLGGHPPEVGYTDGAYINVVTRSGGNRFSGGTTLYYSDENMVQSIWPDEQIQALGVGKPVGSQSWFRFDGSLSLGGPIMKDRLWFFSSIQYIKRKQGTRFIPFTDPYLGRYHGLCDWTHEEKLGFAKLTSQLTSNIKLMGMFNFVERYQPMWEKPGGIRSPQATHIWDHEKAYIGSGILSYILDQNTFFEIRVGYVHRWFPLLLQEEARDLPRIRNWGEMPVDITTADRNITYVREKLPTQAHFAHFHDSFLGGKHEFKSGVELEDAYTDIDTWRQDNLMWYWRNDSPYYYGTTFWNGVRDVGYGRIYFYTCGPQEGSSRPVFKTRRIGAYIQDSVTFADRLTLNLGLRFDRSWGWQPAITKAACGNPLSIYVGENYVRPYTVARYPETFPNGINPFGEVNTEEWKSTMVWNAWSPRIGLTFDILGNGKTVLKATFSRYAEYMMMQYFTPLHPFRNPLWVRFDWYDMNFNQQVDTGDDFTIYPTDYRVFDSSFSINRLDSDVKSPLNDEFTVGIWDELFKNFSLGVNFIYKEKKNILEDGLYAPDTDEWWYHMDQAGAKKYWVPFTAIVPSEDYGDRTVTFYVRKNDAPDFFRRVSNLPELKRKYWALEFLFNKRMAEGWQFSGSVIYSKASGNIGVWLDETHGYSAAADSANYFVNSYGRLSMDIPLQIKLMGTVKLPFCILLSAYYRDSSGWAWVRSVDIMPPSSWCEANNAYRDFYRVPIEDPGQPRRTNSWNTLDLRLEKEFKIGKSGRLGVFVDAFDFMSFSTLNLNVVVNDIQAYYPVAENDNTGDVVKYSDYKDIYSVSGGVRWFSLSIRFSF
ncbi:MAG: TonB-dependent receptor [Candidatus Aminicenantes bacterium]|nr:MAG: TonB-dependent receptor [Candidatus Aminicenantes bacterium]